MPATIIDGLLAGFRHPIFGPEHLMFLLSLGVIAAFVTAGPWIILAFIVASITGVLIRSAGWLIAMSEPLVALSLLVVGAFFITGRSLPFPLWLAIAVLAGVVHGYTFGEAVVGGENVVTIAYLAGLAIMQYALAAGMSALTRNVVLADGFAGHRVKAAGGALVAMGLLCLATALFPD